MKADLRRKVLAGAALLAIAVAGVSIYLHEKPVRAAPGLSPFAEIKQLDQAVPVMFDAPSFDFLDQDGRRAGDAALRGRIWIADFIFTHCGGQCPMVTARMVELQKAITDPDVRFVSFSVDPDRDDSKTLKGYAATHHAGESRWLLLRPPDRKSVTHVAQQMAAMARSPDVHDEIIHTDFFVLIDANGKVRGLYDSKEPGIIEKLKSDVMKVAREHAMGRTAEG